MHRSGGRLVAAVVATALVLGACSAFDAGTVDATQRAWCQDHQLPDPAGGPSVAASARTLGVASAEVERALGALDATVAEGVRLLEEAARAEVTGDQAVIQEARAAYATWQTDVAAPAQQALGQAVGAWSTKPEWAEACADAYGRRGTAGGSPATTLPPAGATAEPTTGATTRPTTKPRPTATPVPPPKLSVNKTINYTSSTSVGRLIELTIKVRNPGPRAAGTFSVQVEGVGYLLKSRTPVVGCVPNCRAASGAEGVSYVQWPAPAKGKSRTYTIQLRALRTGSYRIEVRTYRGPAGNPIDDLVSWTVKVRVR